MKNLIYLLSLLLLAACVNTNQTAPPISTPTQLPTTVLFEDVELVVDELGYVEASAGAPLYSYYTNQEPLPIVVAAGKPLFVLGWYDGWYRVRNSDNLIYYVKATHLSKPRRKPSYTRGNTPSTSTPASRSSYSPSSSQTIMTGPRGGRYYINKNGNKTYIKRN